MKNIDLLFHVFKADTKADNDVWKASQTKWHPNINKSLIGKTKLRYTIPIALLGKTKSGKKILLLIQTSTAKLDFNNFVIEANKFSKKLEAKIQYIYVFNIRIGLDDELLHSSKGSLISYGEIIKAARNKILSESLCLIKNTKREKTIEKILSNKLSSIDDRQWKSIIKENQFSKEENIFRNGTAKKKK